jgi:hypothetical protein
MTPIEPTMAKGHHVSARRCNLVDTDRERDACRADSLQLRCGKTIGVYHAALALDIDQHFILTGFGNRQHGRYFFTQARNLFGLDVAIEAQHENALAAFRLAFLERSLLLLVLLLLFLAELFLQRLEFGFIEHGILQRALHVFVTVVEVLDVDMALLGRLARFHAHRHDGADDHENGDDNSHRLGQKQAVLREKFQVRYSSDRYPPAVLIATPPRRAALVR